MANVLDSLSEDEYRLVRGTRRKALAELDEEELLKVHRRVRKARRKYVSVYRRRGAEKVKERGGRGLANKTNVRRAETAAVFEEALSRVSRQLAIVTHASAQALKTDRLERAKKAPVPFAAVPDGGGKVGDLGRERVDGTRERSGRKKYEASSAAKGQRRQAKKDKR